MVSRESLSIFGSGRQSKATNDKGEMKKLAEVRLDTSFMPIKEIGDAKYVICSDGIVEISPAGITHYLNVEQIEKLAEKIKELREAKFFEEDK